MPDVPAPSPPRRSAGKRVLSWTRRLGLAGVDYLKTYHFKKYLVPVGLVTRGWKMGWATRFVLFALVVGALGTGLALDCKESGPVAAATLVLEILEVAFFALAWSVAVAAATALPAWGFVIVAAWFCQTSILALGAVKFTPLMVLPTWWLVVTGWRLCVTDEHRLRGLVTWLVLAAGAGYATAGPSGFRQALDLPRINGQVVAGVLYALGGGALWWRRRRQLPARPGFAGTLAVALPLMTVMLVIAWWRDRTLTVSWMPDLFGFVDAVVFLFWLWSGGEAFLRTWKMIDWGLSHIVRLNLTRLLVWLMPVGWLLALVVEWGVSHSTEVVAILERLPRPIGDWMEPALRWMIHAPAPVWYACQRHQWITAGVLVIALVQRLRGKLSVRTGIAAGGIWIVSFMGLLAYVAGAQEIIRRAQGAESNPGLWAFTLGALTLLLGLAGVQKDWRSLSEDRVRGQLGWMTAAVAIVLTARIAKGAQAEVEQLLYLHLGMIYFGLARVAYARLSRRTPAAARITMVDQAVVAGVGLGCGWAGHMAGVTGPVLLWLPLVPLALWLTALLVMRKIAAGWDRLAGAMAGALLGAGTLFYTIAPFPVNLPFVSAALVTPAAVLEKRPPLGDLQQFGLVALYTVAAGALGWVVFSRRSALPAGPVPERTVTG